MSLGVSESELYTYLRPVRHPEFEEYNLVDLGMIPEIELRHNLVRITVALPFPNLPIKVTVLIWSCTGGLRTWRLRRLCKK